jgi:thiamine pyrophosphate-dependent acetolactate synthase large subunit-like protein
MSRAKTLDRRAVVRSLLAERGDLLVVTGLGAPSWDATASGDSPLTFPLWGAMGSAAMVGLGLALAQPERDVLVLTGDGEMLMGLGSLATIGVQRPANLALAVLDNERYGETGMQETHTAHGVDLAAIAAGCGFAESGTIRDMAGIAALRARLRARQGPLFAQVKIAADAPPMVLPPRDGGLLKTRFRAALLGPDAALA